jgi:Flp pilus assembly protein TadG
MKILNNNNHRAKRFLTIINDRQGSVVIMFAMGISLLLLAVGGALEFGEAIYVKNKLGTSIDSAALAAATSSNINDRSSNAQRYFEENYMTNESAKVNYNSLLVSNINQEKISINANTSLPTAFLATENIERITVNAATQVEALENQVSPDLDMVVVADNSTSMLANKKFTGLVTALNEIVLTLNMKSPAVEKNVRFALATYNTILHLAMPLTSDINLVSTNIKKMALGSKTCGSCGLQGGVMLFSSADALFAPLSARSDGATYSKNKTLIFMTDGLLNTRLDGVDVTNTKTTADDLDPHNEAIAQCNALKAMGVTVYTIGFGVDALVPPNVDTLRSCASDGVGGKLYYYAPDNATLSSLFKTIVRKTKSIKLTK